MSIEDAKKLHHEGKLQEAEIAFKTVLEKNPNSIEALHALGIIAAQQENFFSAIDFLQQAIKLQPNNPILHLHLANVYKVQKSYKQAIQLLEDLLKNHPGYAPAYNNLGTLYYLQSKLAEAIYQYKLAIEKQPEYIDAYYNLGLALTKNNQFEEAIKIYSKLLDLSPEHFAARFHLACNLMQLNKITEAEKQFLKIQDTHPYHYETQLNLATCFLKQGAVNAAKKHYSNALELNQEDTQVLFNLGVINMQQGNIDLAIQNYQRVIQINPDNIDAHNNLGVAFLAKPHVGLALHHFQEVLRLNPKNSAVKYIVQALSKNQRLLAAPPDYITSLFDAYADHYDAHLVKALDYKVPELLFSSVKNVSSIPTHKWDILDIGCGTGLCAIPFVPAAKSFEGVDLSSKMLDVAASKNIYSHLTASDIDSFLINKNQQYDLVIAGDVFVYIGDLEKIFKNIRNVLRKEGLFVFNTEISEDSDFKMNQSGRFAHQKKYLDDLASGLGFKILFYKEDVTRLQNNESVYGHLYVLQAIC